MAGRRNKRAAGSAGGAAAQRKALEDDDGAGLVETELTEEELKARGEELISWLVKREQIEAKKASAVEKYNAEIKLSKQKIHVLTREIDTKKAYVDPQQSLFDDAPSPPPVTGNDAQAAAS